MRSAPHFLALALAVFLLGCGSANTEPRTAQPVTSSSASSSEAEAAVPRRAFFSGEIVYRQTAVPRSEGGEPVDLGDLHYFISGPHWKHVDANGQTMALYDSVGTQVLLRMISEDPTVPVVGTSGVVDAGVSAAGRGMERSHARSVSPSATPPTRGRSSSPRSCCSRRRSPR